MRTSIAPERLFIDTWGWLVLADAADPAHAATVDVRRRRTRPGGLVTTDFILDETLTRLFSRCPFASAQAFANAIFAAEQTGVLALEWINPPRFREAWRLRGRYRDKPLISFTDLSSFAVMKELGIRDVLSADGHFTQAQLGFRCLPR